MKAFIVFVLAGAVLYCNYQIAFKAGWEGYKKSRNMQYALDSAYQYGVFDCQKDKARSRMP